MGRKVDTKPAPVTGAATGVRRGPIIAIDGPAGAGKSTMARLLARRLGFPLLDSGALYRAMALHLTRLGIAPEDGAVPDSALNSIDLRIEPDVASMKLFLGGEDVGEAIRDERIGQAASKFSARREVRRALLGLQRSVGARGNVVVEGRDMGSVVFPNAEVKFFITADPEERARRRYEELLEKNGRPRLSEVRSEMRARDVRDESRAEAPLVQAPDAVVVDTTSLTPDEVLQRMMDTIMERLGDGRSSP